MRTVFITCLLFIISASASVFAGGERRAPLALPVRGVVLSPDNGRSSVAEAFNPELYVAPGVSLYPGSAGFIVDTGIRFFPADLVSTLSCTFERMSADSFDTTLLSAGATIGIPLRFAEFLDLPDVLSTFRMLPYGGAAATWRIADGPDSAPADENPVNRGEDGFLVTFSLGFDADVEIAPIPGVRAGFRLDWRGSAGSVPFMRLNPSLILSYAF